MSISTYAELQTAIASWVHRGGLTSVIPDFITLSEAKFNRRLRTRQQESEFTATAPVSYEISLPSDFLAVKKLWRTQDNEELVQRPLAEIKWRQEGGESTGFAIGDTLVTDGTSEIEGVYFAKIPALSDSNTTNWLLTAYPDVYLFAGLAEAAFYMKDIEKSAMWTARADALVGEIARTSNKDQFSGTLRVVAR